MQTEQFSVSGMTCGGCAAKVTNALKAINGVQEAQVSLADAAVVVQFDEQLTTAAAMKSAVQRAGYGTTGEDTADDPDRAADGDEAKIRSKRHFLTRFALGAATLPLLRWAPAPADAVAHLAPDAPAAKALAYTENAAGVDAMKEPLFKTDRQCANCQLFQVAQAKDDYAPCLIFPGKTVSSKGWCRAWAAISKAS